MNVIAAPKSIRGYGGQVDQDELDEVQIDVDELESRVASLETNAVLVDGSKSLTGDLDFDGYSPIGIGSLHLGGSSLNGEVFYAKAIDDTQIMRVQDSGDKNVFLLSNIAAGIPSFNVGGSQCTSTHLTVTGTTDGYINFSDGNSPTASIKYVHSALRMEFGLAGSPWMTLDDTKMALNLPIYAEDGSAALPSYTFTSDTDTGIFWGGSGTVGITGNGIRYASFANGLFTYTNSNTDNANKTVRIACTHYDIDEEPMCMFVGNSNGTTNTLSLGGSTSVCNAVTAIYFFTAGTIATPGGTQRMVLGTTNLETSVNVLPTTTELYTLGSLSKTFEDIYTHQAVTVTSDARKKNTITNIDDFMDIERFIDGINIVAFKWNEKVVMVLDEKTGEHEPVTITGIRFHLGCTAQNTKQELDAQEIDLGIWVKEDITDPNSAEGLRPEQYIYALIRYGQKSRARILELEDRCLSLENRVSVLEL